MAKQANVDVIKKLEAQEKNIKNYCGIIISILSVFTEDLQ